MSVTDPAIKDLKACIQKFLEEKSGKIDDDHRYLSSFCQKLENIFYNGLKNANKLFTRNEEPLDWLLEISKDKTWDFPFYYSDSLYKVEINGCSRSKLGKFRLLLRYCLVNKCLHAPVEYLVSRQKFSRYYNRTSILGDEILCEILLSVFLQCGTIKFDLDLSNVYFLESTWLLPDIVRVELVPSRSLGVTVTFSDEKAIIKDIDRCGAAAECGQIEVGDILENINGISINSSSRGKLNYLIKTQRSRPINLIVIKALKRSNNNTLYIPMRRYLLDANVDILSIQNRRKERLEDRCFKEIVRDGYSCVFVGSYKIGMEGDCRQIERTIREIMKNRYLTSGKQNSNFNRQVYVQIGEMSVRIVEPETGNILYTHDYMDISACGSSIIYYNYFGYIKGNDKEEPGIYTCFIFHTKEKEDVAMIMNSIGQGFKRTTYAV